jgi:ubiquinone/menaquinone biosynthesis C-methylase UbiE
VNNSDLFPRLYDPLTQLPEKVILRSLRREVLRGLRGRVLEVGIGTGKNLSLYPPAVEHGIGIDREQVMLGQAEKRAPAVSFLVELVPATADELLSEEGSFGAVVSTLVLCSVADPPRADVEVRRVLKSGGEFRLLEHVKMEQRPIRLVQEKATPLWKQVAGRCHLDRDTLSTVGEVGFEVERVERHLGRLVLSIFVRKPWRPLGMEKNKEPTSGLEPLT